MRRRLPIGLCLALAVAVGGTIPTGCASYLARRERYENLGEGELIVHGKAEEFVVGGRATFLREECGSPLEAPGTSTSPCREVVLGGGDVIERLDRFHFVVRADPGVEYGRATRLVPAASAKKR